MSKLFTVILIILDIGPLHIKHFCPLVTLSKYRGILPCILMKNYTIYELTLLIT